MILDEPGIRRLRLSFGMISWTDIVALRIASVTSGCFLCVEFGESNVRLPRLSSLWRRLARLNHPEKVAV